MTESELLERLVTEGLLREEGEALGVSGWSSGPADRYAFHDHGYDKVLVTERGSIRFELADTRDVELRAGDRLDLPAGTRHAALVGTAGVRCLEAHLPIGRLAGPPRLRTGWIEAGSRTAAAVSGGSLVDPETANLPRA
jgi:quercetin dioxygenase-like cupin family protein